MGSVDTSVENYFTRLYNTDISDKIRKKKDLNYISWASSWAELKQADPDATFEVYEDEVEITQVTESGTTIKRTFKMPWFVAEDGRSGWVKLCVTAFGRTITERYPITDFANRPISAEKITSVDANNSLQRALAKACARHGIGLYLYEGEDMPEETKELTMTQRKCLEAIQRKCKNEKLKDKVATVCKDMLPEENGDPTLCDNTEVLEQLYKKLMAIR